jgi:PAS domain S-box-containing protein
MASPAARHQTPSQGKPLPVSGAGHLIRLLFSHVQFNYIIALLIITAIGFVGYAVFLGITARSNENVLLTQWAHTHTTHAEQIHMLLETLTSTPSEGGREAIAAEILITLDYASMSLETRTALPILSEINEQNINHFTQTYEDFLFAAAEVVALDIPQVDSIAYQTQATSYQRLYDIFDALLIMSGRQNAEQLQALNALSTTLLAVVLGTLVFIYVTIFHPMMRRIERGRERLLVEIEERKMTEQRLRRSETLYRMLIDHLPRTAVLMFDHDLRHTLLAGSFLAQLGYPRERFEGRTLADALSEEPRSQLEPHYREALAGKENTQEGVMNNTYFRAQYLPFRDVSEEIVGGLILVQDITEEKKAAKNLVAAAVEREKAKILNDFVRDISHDFRTPLAVLNTSLFLLTRSHTTEQLQQRSKIMEKQVERLARLLDQLVTMSALETGASFHLERVNIPSLLQTLFDRFSTSASKNTVQLTLEGSDGGIYADADQMQISRALSNLIENALQYTPSGGSIRLGVQLDEEHDIVRLTVADTGAGIPPEDIPHVFDRFYRTDKARGAETGGAGLGLTMVKKIIERHEGSITIESIVGEGTCVELRLPLSRVEVPTQQQQALH